MCQATATGSTRQQSVQDPGEDGFFGEVGPQEFLAGAAAQGGCCPLGSLAVQPSHRPVLGHRAYFRMFTARATTSIPTTREIDSSAIIMSFAHGLMAETSVGLNAIEVLKDRCR